MSDINKMDFKQLRNEVQLLRDELAMFKRVYEDAIYNIDIDNLSTRIVKEKDDKAAFAHPFFQDLKFFHGASSFGFSF